MTFYSHKTYNIDSQQFDQFLASMKRKIQIDFSQIPKRLFIMLRNSQDKDVSGLLLAQLLNAIHQRHTVLALADHPYKGFNSVIAYFVTVQFFSLISFDAYFIQFTFNKNPYVCFRILINDIIPERVAIDYTLHENDLPFHMSEIMYFCYMISNFQAFILFILDFKNTFFIRFCMYYRILLPDVG